MGEQQADRAEVGELARLGHAQAEVLAAAGGGRVLEQAHRGIDRDAVLGILQHGLVQADAGQQVVRIQAEVLGRFQVVGEDGGANQFCHVRAFLGGGLALGSGPDRKNDMDQVWPASHEMKSF
ncbi:hypothetical protein D3C80_1289220 [compost metagenome]